MVQVGKLDANFAFAKDAARARTNNLPGPFQGMHYVIDGSVGMLHISLHSSTELSGL